MVSSDALYSEQPSSIEGDLREDGWVSEVQVRIGAERDLAGPHAPGASVLLWDVVGIIRDHHRAAILLEKISSDQFAWN